MRLFHTSFIFSNSKMTHIWIQYINSSVHILSRMFASQTFCLSDSVDNTAGIRTQRSGFNRQEQNVYLLPILVVDSGPPALSSTGTLTIHVCGCDPDGAIQSCNATAYIMSSALSPGALIALLVCILILIGKAFTYGLMGTLWDQLNSMHSSVGNNKCQAG